MKQDEQTTHPVYLCLYQPDIPQNTGTLMRFAACLDIPIDIIEPAGFDMSDRTLKRAGMDYLEHVNLHRHRSFQSFQETLRNRAGRLVLTSTKADTPYTDFPFRPGDHILMGRESAGVPDDVHAQADARVVIPMQNNMRSINVALSAAMIVAEAVRQLSCQEQPN